MENRCKLLRELSSTQFAAFEMHLYLDTHKCDKKAMEMYRKYNERAKALAAEYEEKFGPLTHEAGSGEAWVMDPWPWEYKECGC